MNQDQLASARLASKRWRLRNLDKAKQIVKRYAETHPDVIKRRNDKWNSHLLKFKDKRLALLTVVRTNVCSKCKRTTRTALHHFTYDYTHPEWYVKELCLPCHNAEHARLRKLKLTVPEINKHIMKAKEMRYA